MGFWVSQESLTKFSQEIFTKTDFMDD
jgi:hypothetical protein